MESRFNIPQTNDDFAEKLVSSIVAQKAVAAAMASEPKFVVLDQINNVLLGLYWEGYVCVEAELRSTQRALFAISVPQQVAAISDENKAHMRNIMSDPVVISVMNDLIDRSAHVRFQGAMIKLNYQFFLPEIEERVREFFS